MPDDGSTRVTMDEIRSVLETAQPPAGLEDRVVAAARRDGRLSAPVPASRTSAAWWRLAAAAVLTVVAFAAGYVLGPGAPPPPETAPEGDLYVLLLHETDSSAPTDPQEIDRLVSEYGAWGRRMARDGIVVGGEKLEVDGVVLDATGEDLERRSWTREPGFLGGYFLIRAESYEEAAEIASTCPHLEYGGEIEIRRIDER